MLSHCDTWSFATRYMVFGVSIHGLSPRDRCLFAIAKLLATVFFAQTWRPQALSHPKSLHNFLTKITTIDILAALSVLGTEEPGQE